MPGPTRGSSPVPVICTFSTQLFERGGF
jgi:hypothetical protein